MYSLHNGHIWDRTEWLIYMYCREVAIKKRKGCKVTPALPGGCEPIEKNTHSQYINKNV